MKDGHCGLKERILNHHIYIPTTHRDFSDPREMKALQFPPGLGNLNHHSTAMPRL